MTLRVVWPISATCFTGPRTRCSQRLKLARGGHLAPHPVHAKHFASMSYHDVLCVAPKANAALLVYALS